MLKNKSEMWLSKKLKEEPKKQFKAKEGGEIGVKNLRE